MVDGADATPVNRVLSAGVHSLSSEGPRRIENVVDWPRIIRKYVALTGHMTEEEAIAGSGDGVSDVIVNLVGAEIMKDTMNSKENSSHV